MKKIIKSLVVAIALISLTATGVWAAIQGNTFDFGGQVKFEVKTAGVDIIGVAKHGTTPVGEGFEYLSEESENYDENNLKWEIPAIDLLQAKPTVTYTFTFTNRSTVPGEIANIAFTKSLEVTTGSASSFSFTGGAEGQDGTNSTTVAAGESVVFEYKLTLTNFLAASDVRVRFAVVVSDATPTNP